MIKQAFTLAEILITLGIVGIVAAMTLPSLIQDYQISANINRLKNTYSILSQAVKASEADNGFVYEWDFVSITPKKISVKIKDINMGFTNR